MTPIKLYEWITGTMSNFTKPFQENEDLFNQAKAFWSHLDGSLMIAIVIFLVLGIALAAFYYKPYNEKPGRHYRPQYWFFFLAVTFVLTFVVTLGFECFAVKPVLKGAAMLELKIAIVNAFYALIIYLLTSVAWCNWFPTNAYRLLKFKRQI